MYGLLPLFGTVYLSSNCLFVFVNIKDKPAGEHTDSERISKVYKIAPEELKAPGVSLWPSFYASSRRQQCVHTASQLRSLAPECVCVCVCNCGCVRVCVCVNV